METVRTPRNRVWLGAVMLTIALLLPFAVRAAEDAPTPDTHGITTEFGAAARAGGFGQQEAQPQVIIVKIMRVTFTFIGILLVALLLYGGFTWMTAGGAPEKVEKAKKTIRNAIIGIIIVFSAYAISRFVVNALVRTTTSGTVVEEGSF